MTTINDGGPAFPVWELNGKGQPEMTGFGMTLRDYFAAKAEGLHDDATPEFAEALTGRKQPDVVHGSPENMLEWARFRADADAVLRYIQADAMLRAREASNDHV